MLLSGYTKRVFRPECNPNFESLHCKAQLHEDVGAALPYLNAVLGGSQYFHDPPEVMFHHNGRIIRVAAREIAVNALADETEADRILAWLKDEINQVWKNRSAITPSYAGKSKPKVIDILRQLPRTNCRRCGLPTCMTFAAQAAEGGRGAENCPEMSAEGRITLSQYLAGFDFE